MTAEQKQELYRHLDTAQTHWTTQHVRAHISAQYQVSYSRRQVQRVLRSLGLYYGKPYVLDRRRSEQSEAILTERLRAVWRKLRRRSITLEEIALGFGDECSPRTRAHRVRLWSTRRVPLKDLSTHYWSSTFGLYAVLGRSINEALANSRSESFEEVLQRIKEENSGYKAIIVIWDNLPSHKTKDVRACAKKLGIELVNIPEYAPDLNPIESIWKSMRRAIAEECVIESGEQLRDMIETNFMRLAESASFAASWIEKFFYPIFDKTKSCSPNSVF